MQRPYFLAFFLLTIFLNISSATGQASRLSDDAARPKIGLVLSGGGARGAAHLGVLKVLEENQIPIDMIAGTSFGALVGGLYSAGYSADELSEILEGIDWQAVLSSEAPRSMRSFRRKRDDDGFLIQFRLGVKEGKLRLPSGLVTPNNLRLTLRGLVTDVIDTPSFSNLATPFRAVATDLETGDAVVLNTGDLASAMVASMAVPALFPPVEHGGKLLVDGGVSNNVPVDVVRAMGADIVIVVDISTPLKTKADMASFTSVINQLTLIMTNKNAQAQLDTLSDSDVVIRPDIAGIGLVDFDQTQTAIPKGAAATNAVLHKLKPLMLSRVEWQDYIAARQVRPEKLPIIDFVQIDNTSNASDEIIRSRLSIEPGQVLDHKALSEDLTKIYGLRLFDGVGYRTIKKGDLTGLAIQAKGRKNGDAGIRFGLALQDNFSGESGYQMAAGFSNLAMNARGGELQAQFVIGDKLGLFTEFYQPIDYADRYYLFANGEVNKVNNNINAQDGSDELLAQVRAASVGFEIGAGRNFGQWGTARIGLQKRYSRVRGRIGLPSSVVIPIDATMLTASFEVDTLDNVRFPHSGIQFSTEYANNLAFIGGDSHVDNLLVSTYMPYTWGKNTLGLSFTAGTSFNGEPNETDLLSLGGFLGLTAFAPGQLSGNHGGVLGAIYYRRIGGGLGYLAQTPLYLGGTIETGNVWNDSSDISLGDLKWSSSLFVGADTLIGPVYLGGAIGSRGETAAFLYIGQLF